jgi:hypothetical protein
MTSTFVGACLKDPAMTLYLEPSIAGWYGTQPAPAIFQYDSSGSGASAEYATSPTETSNSAEQRRVRATVIGDLLWETIGVGRDRLNTSFG